MKILVTGSAGHLGSALCKTLLELNHEVVGIDILPSQYTTNVGSIADREFVASCMEGVQTVLHTATLHKPHVATHTRQQFIDTNNTGTLNLLEEAVLAKCESFIFTSTTSVFGDSLIPPLGEPAIWVTENTIPSHKNIYGVTKLAAEGLCELFYRNQKLPCLILRTSRFFPEEDDNKEMREKYAEDNIKVVEYLNRRVDISDVVDAHLLALEKVKSIGFGKYIISATTPYQPEDLVQLRSDSPAVLAKYVPEYVAEFERRGWKMFPTTDRVYVNELARTELGWKPKYDFAYIISLLKEDKPWRSPLSLEIGSKGYHCKSISQSFTNGPFPVEENK